MRREIAFMMGIALLVSSSARAAETHPPVVLTLGACAGVDPVELRRILPIELDAPLTEAHEAGALDVSVQCEGELAHLRVEATPAPLARTIDLSSTPAVGRSRYLAIAIAELVSAPEAPAPTAAPAPAPPSATAVVATAPPVAVAPAEARPLAPSSPRASWTTGAIVRERVFTNGLLSFGGAAYVRHPLTPYLGLAVDVGADHGSVTTSLGQVDVTTASAGALLSAHRSWRWVTTHYGFGLRGGVSNVSGSPRDSATTRHGSFVAPWGGPTLEMETEGTLASRVTLGLGCELGANVIPSHALVNGAPEQTLAGIWFGAHVSVGVRF